jgi:serine/threonine protein kinase
MKMRRQQGGTDGMTASRNNYEIGRYLGHGSFATVYIGRHIHTRTKYAIKIIDITKYCNDEEQRRRRHCSSSSSITKCHDTRATSK